MGCPSFPKISFHGPSQVLECLGMFIPPLGGTIPFPALGPHLLEMIGWLGRDSHTCTR